MATTTFTTMIPTPQPKKPGPPVPPRPQQSSLLKRDVSSSSSSNAATTATSTSTQRLMSKVGLEQPQILKKPIITNANNNNSNGNNTTTANLVSTSVTTSGGRTVIYKSPSLNLQKRQEEREKRNEASTQTTTTAITRTTSAAAATTAAKAKLTNGTQAPKPPLKLRKAPDVPTNFKPRITTPPQQQQQQQQTEVKETETKTNDNHNANNTNNANNIVIVQSSQGVVTLNRHHSMGAGSPQNKPSALAKDTRLSLGKADFERVGKIQVQQLQPTTQPLPKPRKIVKVPVATLDVEDTTSSSTSQSTSSSSSNTLHVNSLFKRSKTSIENFTSRSNITTVNTSTTGSYLSGKTVEIKNNLKNAAERLFSEIMVNQQKQNAMETTNTIITKHERAIQHQAEPMMLNNANNSNNITVVTTSKDYGHQNDNNNCTRINITANNHNNNNNNIVTNNQVRQVVSAFNSPEKKSAAFHEMLISELAAMRTRSCSMENLQTTKQLLQQPPQSPQSVKETTIDKQFQNYKQFKTLENQLKVNNNKPQQQQQQQDQQQQHKPPLPPTPANNKRHHHHNPQTPDDDIDADNIEDADGDVEEDLKKSLKVIAAQNTPRKRTPSGCSSDSSPYGTERSARIRTSDWIEVGDNGKQVTLTSCHISLEDSGLEDEERMDEMSSSGVGDSWDSVKEAEQQQQQQQLQQQQQAKRNRNVKRIMSINDLPPLPKSLSGINKMLASDSGLVSDVDTEIKNTKNNDLKQYENQKENNNNLNINHNNNTNNNNNNSNTLKDLSDKFNNASLSTTTTTANTLATTTTSSTTTPLKEINGNETISEIPPAIPGSKLDTQIATLRKEMFGLRQLDLSLLSQLWALNDSIQEFRTMIQEQEQDDDETYSTHSRSPSPYDSVSSDAEDEILTLKSKNRMELQNGNVITTQPKLTTKSYNTDSEITMTNQLTTNTTSSTSSSSSSSSSTTPSTVSSGLTDQQQKSQLLKPPLPKPLDVKPVPRMRSAPPPPPTHRKSQTAPPRPT